MERIHIKKNKQELEIEIYPLYNKQKHTLMLIWLALWTVCGIAVFSQLLGQYDIKTKFFFILYLLFWMFFEYKVVYAHRWRTKGKEVVKVKDGKIHIIKDISGRIVEQIFDISEIDSIEIFSEKENSMSQLLGNAYWMISAYQLAFRVNGKIVPFGIELSDKDKKKIIFELNRFLKSK
jgi:hypothetical protein